MKNLLKGTFDGWNKFEVIWLLSATAIITGLSIFWGDSLLGILSALTGVVCVILTAKGRVSCFVWGLVNCVLYAYIGFQNQYYGEFMLNAFYYVPMQFIGFYIWHKNLNKQSNEVKAKVMSVKSRLILFVLSVVGVLAWGYWLQKLGGQLPYIDAITNVLSIIAMIISIKRYAEQWILWVVIDVVSVGMWIFAMYQGSENLGTLLMWSVYLFNAIWGYWKWHKEGLENKLKEGV